MTNASVSKIDVLGQEGIESTCPVNFARTAWRATVAAVAERVKHALPAANGRIDAAVKLVLMGDVVVRPDGSAQVASQSNGATTYIVVNGVCECPDFPRAPRGWCKHRLAVRLATRATRLHQRRNGQVDAPAAAVAAFEAPASVTVRLILPGRDVHVTLRDQDEGRLLSCLQALLTGFSGMPVPEAQDIAHTASAGFCERHNVAMQCSQDGKRWFHKAGERPDGAAVWCRGT